MRRMRRLATLLRLLLLLPLPLALAGCELGVAEIGLPLAGGGLPITIRLQSDVDPANVRVLVDGADVSAAFAAAGAGRIAGSIPLPAPGAHVLTVSQGRASVAGQPLVWLSFGQRFAVPAAAPPLLRADPAPVAGAIPRTAWLRLAFDGDLTSAMQDGFGFALECGGAQLSRKTYTVSSRSLLLDPQPGLPAGASCRAVWRDASGVAEHRFSVAAGTPGASAHPLYDRENPLSLAPFPDDWWTRADATAATGRRLSFEGPSFGDTRDAILAGISASLAPLDGWSPIGPIVLAFSHAVETAALPADEAASEDPFAPIALLDMDPASSDYGARVPYTAEVRNDPAPDATIDHLVVIYPAVTLRPGGQYAVVVTRRLAEAGDPGNPFAPSDFFARVAAPAIAGESAATARARGSAGPVLDFLASVPAVPIARDDVALALRISTRSSLRDASDLVAMKENALAAPPPPVTVTSAAPTSKRALVVKGTLALPDYLEQPDAGVLHRDPATGRPQPWRTESVPFVMSLPQQALAGPVPVVVYQHGSPGSPNEVLGSANEFLDDAGYAIVGIQDVANRRYGADSTVQTVAILLNLMSFGRLPLAELQTHADMLSLLRALGGIAARDWLPAGAPDGRAEIDASRVLFRGISFGSHHSLGFLPLAPEVTAAVSVVGAGRYYENTIHQIDFFGIIGSIQQFVPALRPVELIVGLAAIQNDEDRQDPHLLARHLYRERLAIAGIPASARPPSLLWLEGIGDHLVSNNGTRAAARELGIPQVGHARRETPVLEHVPAPLSGNVSATRTAGHYQYEPAETPSCRDVFHQLEGHYCAQVSLEAQQQILRFFSTALAGGAPEIIDPLP